MPTPNLPPPVTDDWILLIEVFRALNEVYGDPDEAAQDIRRKLLRGEVRSLRRHALDDGHVRDVEPSRAYWRDFRFLHSRDNRKRDTITFQWVNEDANASGANVSGGVFYLHRVNCSEHWPFLSLPQATPAVAESGPVPMISKVVDDIIREELRKEYDEAEKAEKKPPNIEEVPDPVLRRVRGRGYHEVTLSRIQQIAKEPEFKKRRLRSGVRWRGTK
jgi:hypothetical protein